MLKRLKYILIPYIALGLVLSMAIGLKYDCTGEELFPTYSGSPFVFKQKSLVTSMQYFYSISGLVLNTLVWSGLLFLLRLGVLRALVKSRNNLVLKIIYKVVVGILVVFSSLNIAVEKIVVGPGFDKGVNYWYFDMEEEAEKWGMECKGEWVFFTR